MATTLTMIQIRVRAMLMDDEARIWDAGALEESIRQALGEYQLAGRAAVTLNGLDGAAATTLDPLHESLIVWGGAAYAALARAVDRAESPQLGSESGDLKAWGEARLNEFKAMLTSVFPGYAVTLTGGADPAKLAAEIALLAAQAAHVSGEESRADAAAQALAAHEQAEAERRAELRASTFPAWGSWKELCDEAYDADHPSERS